MTSRFETSPVHRAMENAVAQQVFPGAVLVWGVGASIVFHRAYGVADLNLMDKVTTDTLFDLASLTKPLATALVTAQLLKEKQILPGTRVEQVLPVTKGTDKGAITVDMLLRHTSGLPSHRAYFRQIDPLAAHPRETMRHMLLAEPLETLPGRKEVYSDLGFMLLAWIIETITQTPLDALARTLVFEPLMLDRLFFPGVSQNHRQGPAAPGKTARRHQATDGRHQGAGRFQVAATSVCPWRGRLIKGEVEDENAWAAGGIDGHAGLFGDAQSVYRLCSAVLGAAVGKDAAVFDPGVLAAFLKPSPGFARVAGFDTPSETDSSSGHFFSGSAVGHLGFTGTSFWMDPADGLIVVLLSNRVHPSRENIKIRQFRPVIHDLIRRCFNPCAQGTA